MQQEQKKESNPEQEIQELERQLSLKKKELLEGAEKTEVTEKREKEILKDIIKDISGGNRRAGSSQSVQQAAPSQPSRHAHQAPMDEEKQKKIKQLVSTAFNKGIREAVDEAKAENDPYVLDAFHDMLVDELYGKLIERGKLEKL